MMNSTRQKSSGGTSGFETIYGMQCLNTEICDQEELGKCMTMEECMKLVSCPRLAREHYYMDGEHDSSLEKVIELKNNVLVAWADVPSTESKVEEEAEEDRKPAAKVHMKRPLIETVDSEDSTKVKLWSFGLFADRVPLW